jgi:hypothetical protein
MGRGRTAGTSDDAAAGSGIRPRTVRIAFYRGAMGEELQQEEAVELTRLRVDGGTVLDVRAQGIRGRDVALRDVLLRDVGVRDVTIRGAWIASMDISGQVDGLVVNGVEVAPLVEAELDRRYPDHAAMRPRDPAGFRHAWDVVEQLWAGTVARGRTFPPEQLHASVDGEWSFIETLRHLVFATECWLYRAVLGDPRPWHPLSLPWDEAPDAPGVPRDREVRPDLDTVLEVRHDRMAAVRRYLDDLTDEDLAADTVPVDAPGWPEPQAYPVRECLLTILDEEWWHRRFAERDLDALENRTSAGPTG